MKLYENDEYIVEQSEVNRHIIIYHKNGKDLTMAYHINYSGQSYCGKSKEECKTFAKKVLETVKQV